MTAIALTALGTPYLQNFDSLSTSGTTNELTITGWSLAESGANANARYAADNGTISVGNTYSYGAIGSTDRALGGLESATLIPIFGAQFLNNTGSTLTGLVISYTGEQWRLGAAGRTDHLSFQYSTSAAGLTTGTYTGVASLDFVSPDTVFPEGAKNGNAAGNRTDLFSAIIGLNIPNGATFWIRWTGADIPGGDDGLAIDDFSLTPLGTAVPEPNPPPPAGTTALMIMSNPTNGTYEVYNVGGNAILAAYQLGQVGTPWTFAALGTFQAGDSSDMLLRNSSSGTFEVYYVSGNNITNAALVGTVGLDWNFAGIGNFDGASSLSELMLRNASSGSFELYQVAGGGVLSGSSVAPVGNNFQVKGFGNFSGSPVTQMIMQDNTNDASAGQLELYTYQPSTASLAGINVGTVGSNLSIVGCANLLGNGMTQMVMQQNNGNFWLYSYNAATNSLSGTLVGAIGSNFHVVGFGPLGTAGRDEMLMQDAAGNFEVYQYNASLNAFVGNSMGAVGAPWVVDGIAANSPSGSGQLGSTAQLVQAMASFGAGAADGLNAGVVNAGTSEQPLLTTPQHA
jgi:hypothetical protein